MIGTVSGVRVHRQTARERSGRGDDHHGRLAVALQVGVDGHDARLDLGRDTFWPVASGGAEAGGARTALIPGREPAEPLQRLQNTSKRPRRPDGIWFTLSSQQLNQRTSHSRANQRFLVAFASPPGNGRADWRRWLP
jgi:hypothetical protein